MTYISKISRSLYVENDVKKTVFLPEKNDFIASNREASSFELAICIDTEYKGHEIFTVQLYIEKWDERIYVFNRRMGRRYPNKRCIIESLVSETLEKGIASRCFVLDLEDDFACNLAIVLEKIFVEKEISPCHLNVQILLYYAVNDLFPMFGFKNCTTAMLRTNDRRFNLERLCDSRGVQGLLRFSLTSGHFVTARIFDPSGLFPKLSLLDASRACGVEMLHKKALDSYKEDMSRALLHQDKKIREQFLRYAMDDCVVLHKIFDRLLLNFNKVLSGPLRLEDRFLFKRDNLPSTIGSLVSKTFQNYIFQLGERECSLFLKKKRGEGVRGLDYFTWSLCRVGYLNPHRSNLDTNRKIRKSLIADYCYLASKDFPKSHLSRYTYAYNAFNLASVNAFLVGKERTMLHTCATVSGGRCVNEQAWKNRFENVLDVDFSSCYATALKELSYPIGKPCVYATDVNEEGMSLGEFLKRHRASLVPGLYKIVVSGKLPFQQDLIFSKFVSNETVSRLRRLVMLDESVSHLNELVLIRDRVHCGVITRELLELIEKVSTNQELKGWLSLRVESAAWYPKEFEIRSISEWSESVVESKQEVNEIAYWTRVPLKDFMEPLIQSRIDLKGRANILFSEGLEEEELAARALAEILKLMSNTVYGCFASAHFMISNTIVGDNVTAKARAEIWMASKALNGIQSITDGLTYCPGHINRFKKGGYKPGFDSLCYLESLSKHRGIEKMSLLKIDWNDLFSKKRLDLFDFARYDVAVKEAINEFWGNYNCKVTFSTEHKPAHTSNVMSTQGKAHYMLRTVEGKTIFKTRGTEKTDCSDNINDIENFINDTSTPFLHRFLMAVAFSIDSFPENRVHTHKRRTGIKEWIKVLQKEPDTNLRPGDYTEKESSFKFNDLAMPICSLADHKKKKSATNRTDSRSYEEKHKCKSPREMLKHMYTSFYKSLKEIKKKT